MAKKKQNIGEVMCRSYWKDQYETERIIKEGSCPAWKGKREVKKEEKTLILLSFPVGNSKYS